MMQMLSVRKWRLAVNAWLAVDQPLKMLFGNDRTVDIIDRWLHHQVHSRLRRRSLSAYAGGTGQSVAPFIALGIALVIGSIVATHWLALVIALPCLGVAYLAYLRKFPPDWMRQHCRQVWEAALDDELLALRASRVCRPSYAKPWLEGWLKQQGADLETFRAVAKHSDMTVAEALHAAALLDA